MSVIVFCRRYSFSVVLVMRLRRPTSWAMKSSASLSLKYIRSLSSLTVSNPSAMKASFSFFRNSSAALALPSVATTLPSTITEPALYNS